MANQILSRNKLHLVLRLLIVGKSRRYISRIVEISRNYVDKFTHIFNFHPLGLHELHKLDDYDLLLIVKHEYQSKSSLETLYDGFAPVVKELKNDGHKTEAITQTYLDSFDDSVKYEASLSL
jgi:hypothetical protein